MHYYYFRGSYKFTAAIGNLTPARIIKNEEQRVFTLLTDEAYTSRTCARCGFVNQKSGGLTLQCAKCGIKNARDTGVGASNILFRTMAAAQLAKTAVDVIART
jgi:predicted nucleic-acid-binding Zn-ribbon protein